MSRVFLTGLLTVALLGTVATGALAQRDAGAKARGEFGRGFYSQRPSYGQYYSGPSFYQPTPAEESYRSFSYEPVEIDIGDAVVVKSRDARVMSGRTQVGTLEAGQEFKVTRVINGWLGVVTEQNGTELRGWVWHRNVEPQVAVAPAPRQATPIPSYRRFSYEPAEVPAMGPQMQMRRPAQRPAPPEVRLRPGTRRY